MGKSYFIAGNWKMNLNRSEAVALTHALCQKIQSASDMEGVKVAIFPPALWVSECVQQSLQACEGRLLVGGQDCHDQTKGAFTGNLSAGMLKDAGCGYVILGHSERRAQHGETSSVVAAKALAAIQAGLVPVICVGETESERESGEAENIVGKQMSESLPETASATNCILAYEPVWAIGTGKTASVDDVTTMHGFIRGKLASIRSTVAAMPVLYGGSVKADNAESILACKDVDGVLVGGASLKAEEFWSITEAAVNISK